MSLEAFGVKNLRCLVDTGLVPIRRITVLVGRNSSGKSTFLRAFPLLRQSVETRRNSPILWYGDEHPVDFGSLKEAASAWLDEPSVTFMFRVRLPESAHVPLVNRVFDVEMTLEDDTVNRVAEYVLRADGQEVRWQLDPAGLVRRLVINGRAVAPVGSFSLGGSAHLLPSLVTDDHSGVTYSGAPERHAFETFDALYHPRDEEMFGKLADDTDGRSRMIVVGSPYLIQAADILLSQLMSRVAYLAPLRVSAQRAYRVTNYAIDEIDPDGKNLAMFLRSLSPGEAASFASFTRDALGFETTMRTTGMHAEILVRAGGSQRFSNLVDVGFGYSEVLPLAAVLWASCIRPPEEGRDPTPLVAIEQPELHLHPAHQARLARMFVHAVTKSRGTRLVVETHSESLINGLGRLIHQGKIEADDVQIVLFDQDEVSEQTTVRLAGYRETGALRDWPYGFLSPVAERLSPPAAAE